MKAGELAALLEGVDPASQVVVVVDRSSLARCLRAGRHATVSYIHTTDDAVRLGVSVTAAQANEPAQRSL